MIEISEKHRTIEHRAMLTKSVFNGSYGRREINGAHFQEKNDIFL